MADLKQYVFFDFEMLCSDRGMEFADMEAIRLGAVKYDLETEKVTSFDRFIRPEQLSPLSDFCKELTGIQDADIGGADDFPSVFEEFLYWVGGVKRTRFFSWSTSDLLRLKADAERNQLPEATIIKINKRYVDFQAIFKKRVACITPSVDNALALYGLSFEGEKHNPMYDAYNTFRIYKAFDRNKVTSDLIMLNQYIFNKTNLPDENNINRDVKDHLKKDISIFLDELNDAIRMKHAYKVIKKTKKLVEKYENILINRSGLFNDELVSIVRAIVFFYQELQISYEEHHSCTAKIMILHEHMISPIQKLSV